MKMKYMNILTADVYRTLKLHKQLIRETMSEIKILQRELKPTVQDHLRRMEYTGRLPKFSVMD